MIMISLDLDRIRNAVLLFIIASAEDRGYVLGSIPLYARERKLNYKQISMKFVGGLGVTQRRSD